MGGIMVADRDKDSSLDEAQRIETPAVLREAARKRPRAPEERPVASEPQHAVTPDPPKPQWVRRGLFLLLPLALVGGGAWYVAGGRMVYTDDAYVNAEKVGVSTDMAGTVTEVDVSDNQEVAVGQVLYRLDPLQFQIALASAKANRAQIALTLESMKRDYRRMLTAAAAEQAQVTLDRTRYERATRLLSSGVESRAGYDQAQYTLQADQSRLEALREEAHVQLAKLGGNPDTPVAELPQYQQAETQVVEAERELVHTVVTAPFAGIVTDVPAIARGKYLPASTTAFYLVDTHHVWIDATPKETQLTYVRAGQPASVKVDTYPEFRWHGTVESLSPAAAQEFALLPAQNTSGNWVKVVQRVQMRIRVDTGDGRLPPLRAGMSTEVSVDTGHARGLPHFLTALF
jgi:membrane fusion protein (multidrug efflux system)